MAEHGAGDGNREPLSREELTRVAAGPHRAIEVVLGAHDRLMQNVVREKDLGPVAALLLLTGVLFAIPYGALPPVGAFWKIATLFTGSLLICFPSLHVFGQYLGVRLSLAQSFVLSLFVAAAAALITFGFAPVIWFIHLTSTGAENPTITSHDISRILLGVSLFLGIVHLARCLRLTRALADSGLQNLVVAGWVVLLIFITYRMGSLLDLL